MSLEKRNEPGTVKVILSTDECYLGTDATEADVIEYNDKLESYLVQEYPDIEFDFGRDVQPKIIADDMDTINELKYALERFWGLWCVGKV